MDSLRTSVIYPQGGQDLRDYPYEYRLTGQLGVTPTDFLFLLQAVRALTTQGEVQWIVWSTQTIV